MIRNIVKRDGRVIDFDSRKIYNAVLKAFTDGNCAKKEMSQKEESKKNADAVTKEVIKRLQLEGNKTVQVEHVQDIVERVISDLGFFDISKKYILYRNKRSIERKRKERVYKRISDIIKATDRENANVGNGPSSKLLQIAETASRDYSESFLTAEDVKKAMDDNYIYPHDYSWFGVGTTTCTFIKLSRLLHDGFNTGHGFIRPPKRIKTAAQLACIIFQANQNDQHGGQAYGFFDRDMAKYVGLERQWQIRQLDRTFETLGIGEDREKIYEIADKYTREETFQAMESLVHNLNSMHSRAGAQVPFTSINVGTDTSKDGRIVTESLLKAYENGLGKGEQALFPNIIFKIRKGINWEEGTANHDLLMYSLKVSSKRLFPNYVFEDCSLFKGFPTDVPVMGCRTIVTWNRHKDEEHQTCEERGNDSFTTINLPGIALKSRFYVKYNQGIEAKFNEISKKYNICIPEKFKDNDVLKTFFTELDYYSDLVIEQLLERLAYQSTFIKEDFPFLMSEVWMGCKDLKNGETVGDAIKNGTLGTGFIGLAEALYSLVGSHHGEDSDADSLGYEIVKFIRKKVDEASKNNDLNFSLLATPAEGLCEKFVERDKVKFGIVKGVTDKAWYTNSFHVPVEFPISIFKKIEIEGKFHHLCNGGHISYVELKEAPLDNTKGMYSILKCMEKNDMGYVAINFPVDRCRKCGNTGVIEGDCPICGSDDISRIRRITGYLAELSNFNHAKREEVKHRLPHGM